MTTTKSYLPDECAVLELRTHCPTPTLRIVRPAGALTPVSIAPLLTMMKVCLHDGTEADVVLDLQDVDVAHDADALLADLAAQVRRRGTALHVTGAGRRPSAEEVVARLALAGRCAGRGGVPAR